MRPERANLKPRRANLKPGRANLMLNGGGRTEGRTDGRKDGWTDGRKDGRTDVSKFPPVFYRTSALWGRCPKRIYKGSKDAKPG